METSAAAQNYELAYHLNPDIEESDLPTRRAELEQLIAQNGGTVRYVAEPKRKHLSYPVHQKRYSYFGWLDFSADPEAIARLNAQLKLQNQVLRFLFSRKEQDEKNLHVLGGERPRPKLKTYEPGAEKAAPEIKPEQMEKEISELLEKI